MSPPNLRYRFIDYPPDPDGTHQGTGDISYPPMLVVPASVPGHVADLLDFNNPTCNISVLCMVLDTPQQPNWYGIAYRKGIQSFDSVNIFCHPHPGNAGMQDKDYQGRGGNWRHLFRYAQNLGMQLPRQLQSDPCRPFLQQRRLSQRRHLRAELERNPDGGCNRRQSFPGYPECFPLQDRSSGRRRGRPQPHDDHRREQRRRVRIQLRPGSVGNDTQCNARAAREPPRDLGLRRRRNRTAFQFRNRQSHLV